MSDYFYIPAQSLFEAEMGRQQEREWEASKTARNLGEGIIEKFLDNNRKELPPRWFEYDLRVEVNEDDRHMIQYLKDTKWEHFHTEGTIYADIHSQSPTRDVILWFGLKRKIVYEELTKIHAND